MLPLETPTHHIDRLAAASATRPATPTSAARCFQAACATPSPTKKRSLSDMSAASPTCVEDAVAAAVWTRVARSRCDSEPYEQPPVEPLHAPATDEIPIADLLFWLGDETTGELACPCRSCCAPRCAATAQRPRSHRRGHYLYIPRPVYSGLSAKIPVIALPRIEGLN